MKIGASHLTYCSNIHAGETWQSVRETLGTILPEVRRRLDWAGPLGVGLRLSAAAAETLDDPPALAEFLAFLAAGDYYVFTINGFPYGAFHGARVKERVYAPDWRQAERLTYTNRLASLLAALSAGHGVDAPSVSTVPGGFRVDVRTDADRAAVTDNLLRHAAHLVDLRRRTGRTITLAIEPEPACQLETLGEVAAFLDDWVFDAARVAAIARETGVALDAETLRRHVGVCLDACHAAVAFEDPSEAIARLRASRIRVMKVQVSSALHVEHPASHEALAALGRFADDVYLHQVVERRIAGDALRFDDLPLALDAARRGVAGAAPWRVHFHVPIFLGALGAFETTQPDLAATIAAVVRTGACTQFEVETYTWDVLPAEYRSASVADDIARELIWARAAIEAAS